MIVASLSYSDLSASKRRPALVVAAPGGPAIIDYKAGELETAKLKDVTASIIRMLNA